MGDLRGLLVRDYLINDRRSLGRACTAFEHLSRCMRTVDPEKVHSQAVEYVLRRRGEGVAASTIRYELAILRRSLTIAFKAGLIDRRPYVPAIQVNNARAGFFEPDEVDAVIAKLSDPIDGIARFGYVTGWRVSEIKGLTWDNVDRYGGTVRLVSGTTKNNEGRTFPYASHPALLKLMARRWVKRDGPYVFHRRGKPVLWFRRAWLAACVKAGVGGRLFHDLRRSAVRNMERAGVPRSIQMKLVGMKTESIHRRYAISNEEDLVRGVELLAASKKEKALDAS